ncbi:MAG: flavin reductase family protein [Bacteroidales bacterium]|nr:flavin reductase family protein [Bacteroidales bacterium]
MLNPTPVVMVSCGNTIDEYNIITVAWTGTIDSDPAMCFISVRPTRHSHSIISRTGEFVINLVNKDLAPIADWCGVKSGKDYHKFLETGLTPIHGTHVSAPLIEESPVNIECKVKQVIPLGTHDMFIAEVLAVHADELLFNHKTDALELQRANLVAYSHGHYYELGKMFGKFGFSVEKKNKTDDGKTKHRRPL